LEQLGSEAKFYRGDAKGQFHREIELMKGIRGLQPVFREMRCIKLICKIVGEAKGCFPFIMDRESISFGTNSRVNFQAL
jgi:hypothetical protein